MLPATPLLTALTAPPPPCPRLPSAHSEFASLEAWLASAPVLQLALHLVESQQYPKGRELQRLLLQAHIQLRGIGDVGPALAVQQNGQTALFARRRVHTRWLKTIFGPIPIVRLGYSQPGAQGIYPLDRDLQLPARCFSYELQKHAVVAAVQGPFQESIDRIAEFSGVSIPKRSLEEVLLDAAQDFDAFYTHRSLPSETTSLLVAAVDAKGIPMVKPERAQRTPRLSKGQKTNRKRMATVAAVFTRLPWIRTAEEVVESLFRSGPAPPTSHPPPPRPENKRVWASLVKGKAAVIAEVALEMQRRDPARSKTHLALSDGERGLQKLVDKTLDVTLILDLIHVVEKLWKAAYVFHAEGSLEAELWVRQRTLRILHGQVSGVVQGLRQSVTKLKLSGAQAKTLSGVANYFYRNRHRMRYDHYLAQGWPIASGPVEGACKNLIKDRMERSGMRWTEAMAEAIVKLRAIYLSGDFEDYWSFHIQQDQQRLHPTGQWSVVPK